MFGGLSKADVIVRIVAILGVFVPLGVLTAIRFSREEGGTNSALAIAFMSGVAFSIGLSWCLRLYLMYEECFDRAKKQEGGRGQKDPGGREGNGSICCVKRCEHCGHLWGKWSDDQSPECPRCGC